VKKDEKTYSLDELSAVTGITKRNVRYYMQKGLVDRPGGTGKGSFYTQTHLEQLQETRKWKQAGLSLNRIHDIVRGVVKSSQKPLPPVRRGQNGTFEVWNRSTIADGVELHIDPVRSGLSREQAKALIEKVRQLYAEQKADDQQ
jgi:DNA-binding transcriptional MerR regulator